MTTHQSTPGSIAAATYATQHLHLSERELRERWNEEQGTRLNPTVPESLRRQASRNASSLWLAAHARGVAL